MKYVVAKLFSAKIGGKESTFYPGNTVNLSEGKAAKLILAGVLTHANIDQMEKEYFNLLSDWWNLDTDPDAMTMDQVRQLVNRLDLLYRALRSNGRNPPVRLPVERKKVA
jgi:hypothetical protein